MSSVTAVISDDLSAFVEGEARRLGFTTPVAYIEDLLRREKDIVAFRSLIREGVESGPPVDADAVSARLWQKIRSAG